MTVQAEYRLWNAQETAKCLGVPVATLFRWRANGSPSPPGIRIGRHLRFRPEVVIAWAADREEETNA